MRQIRSIIASLVLVASLYSCIKDDADHSNNFLTATIISSAGGSQTFSALGKNVTLGCTFFGSSIEAAGNDIKRISFLVSQGTEFNCLSNGGAFYKFACGVEMQGSNYGNITGDTRNELTFTQFRDDYWEGYFKAKCYSETDSIDVSGTFKGDPRSF